MAVAELINQTGLHRRIALKIMTLVGEKPGNFTIQYERHSYMYRHQQHFLDFSKFRKNQLSTCMNFCKFGFFLVLTFRTFRVFEGSDKMDICLLI